MIFLTAWGCEMNKPDKEGSYTPLHLAVIGGNTRIVRRLLQRGADRNLIDKNFKKPIDIAKENDLHNIHSLLTEKSKCCEIYEIKTNLKSNKNKLMGVFLFFVIFALYICLTLVIYLPCN